MTLSAGCYALGYLTGLAAFVWMARRRNLLTAGMMAVMGAGLLGGMVGANLAQWIFGGVAGKTVLGGVAGGYLCVILYKRHLGIRRSTGDLFAVAISAGEAVGRWGCYFGGCCYGKVCSLPWAIRQHGELRHPTQLYLSGANALILWVLLRFDRTRPPENSLFYLQGVLYCAARFTIEFFREGPPPVWGLTVAQWACVAGFAFSSRAFCARCGLFPSPLPERLSQGNVCLFRRPPPRFRRRPARTAGRPGLPTRPSAPTAAWCAPPPPPGLHPRKAGVFPRCRRRPVWRREA